MRNTPAFDRGVYRLRGKQQPYVYTGGIRLSPTSRVLVSLGWQEGLLEISQGRRIATLAQMHFFAKLTIAVSSLLSNGCK